MAEITADDLVALTTQDEITLAQWHCDLNRYKWPAGLPDAEPHVYVPNDRRCKIMCWIEDHVGQKLISRIWNRHMTETEFETWWNSKGKQFHEEVKRIRDSRAS